MAFTIRSGTRKIVMPRPTGSLLEAARAVDLGIPSSCGGAGSCGKCIVFLERGTFEVCGQAIQIAPGERREELACLVTVTSEEAVVSVPRLQSADTENAQIATDIELPSHERRPAVCLRTLDLPPAAGATALSLRERVDHALLAELGGLPMAWSPEALSELAEGPGREGGQQAVLLADSGTGCEVIGAQLSLPAQRRLGLAVDIGTSTVVVALADLADGQILGRAARYNQQVLQADDVASRISLCQRPAELARLTDLVIRHTINPLIAQVCRNAQVRETDLCAVAVAGNTVMSHLFHGLSPLGIGQVPFLPVTRSYPVRSAAELGLHARPSARVYTVPSAAGYIGGDILADLAVCGFERRTGLQLLMDIGTNGEMVLRDHGRFIACATAAGPAFEGAGLRHGCRALPGAIDRITIDPAGHPQCHVLGDLPPSGICGSGAVDFLAAARWVGLINPLGRFDVERVKAIGRYESIRLRQGVTHAYRLVEAAQSGTGDALVVTEYDIAQVLKAKAALYAGLKSLLHRSGHVPADLDRVVLAGGFARYLNLDSAVAIGLLPDLPHERYEIIGNGALAGALLALLDVSVRGGLEDWKDRLSVVELNREPVFADTFAAALAIPYLDPGEFPNTLEIP